MMMAEGKLSGGIGAAAAPWLQGFSVMVFVAVTA